MRFFQRNERALVRAFLSLSALLLVTACDAPPGSANASSDPLLSSGPLAAPDPGAKAAPPACDPQGISADAQGNPRTCCSLATTAAYFGLAANSRPGGCASGSWTATAAACAAAVTGSTEGLVWDCASAGAPTRAHHLGEAATRLANMSETAYDAIQLRWLGTAYPACNYFVETALCEDGQCSNHVPEMLAAQFDEYLLGIGWKEITLDEVKTLLLTLADTDIIANKDGTTHGHVAIPVALGASRQIVLAQGELGGVTHQLKEESDSYMTTLRFFKSN